MTLPSLIAKLESATEGSRELSDEVLLVFGWKFSARFGWRNTVGDNVWDDDRPSPSESLDDCLGMVPEGWAWSVSCSKEYGVSAGISPKAPRDEWVHSDMGGVDSLASTAPLALLIAICRARLAEMEKTK